MTNTVPSYEVRNALKKAKAAVEKGWMKGSLAQDADGKEVDPCSRKAVCWCLDGALQKGAGVRDDLPYDNHQEDIYINAMRYVGDASDKLYPWSVGYVNLNDDNRTRKSMVLRVLDHAINQVPGRRLTAGKLNAIPVVQT